MLTMMIICGKYMLTQHLEFPHLQHFKIRFKSLDIWTHHHTLPYKVLLNIFLPLDHRLNATVHKKLQTWHEVDCVLRCLNDTCCRSVNYLKTLDFVRDEDHNKDNCELLHDAVVSGKKDSLLRNDDYDYFIMENPERVSIHLSLTETDREI